MMSSLRKTADAGKTVGVTSAVLYKNRYCNQEEYDVVCFKKPVKGSPNKVIKLKGPNFTTTQTLTPMLKPHYHIERAVVGTDIYVINEDGIRSSSTDNHDFRNKLCEVYSQKRKKWNKLTGLEEIIDNVCVCSFMQQVYFIGKIPVSFGSFKSKCIKYDPSHGSFSFIAQMNTCRRSAAWTVFEGKLVVCGGIDDRNFKVLKSVEAYDHHENKWNYLPEMLYARYDHELVSMGNKMFVVGGVTDCEVFDSFSTKFTLIKKIPSDGYIFYNNYIVANVRNKFTVYSTCIGDYLIYSYDIVTEEWHKENKKLDEVNYVVNCIRIPSI